MKNGRAVLARLQKHGKMILKPSKSREIFRDNRKTNYDPSNKPCSEQQSPTQPKKRSQIILKTNSRTFNLTRQQRSNRKVAAAVQRATWCNATHTHVRAHRQRACASTHIASTPVRCPSVWPCFERRCQRYCLSPCFEWRVLTLLFESLL